MLHPDLSGYRQMAIDEASYLATGPGTKPVLRFYTWERPTLSLGYFQNFEGIVNEAFCVHNNIDVVRRMTGGRSVLHDREVTYSLAAPLEGIWAGRSLRETYRLIGEALEKGLQGLGFSEAGIMMEEGAAGVAGRLPQCFVRVSRYEISHGARKVIGSAQKRSRTGFLQHGSILLDWNSQLQQGCVLQPDPGIEEKIAPLHRVLGRPVDFEEVASSFSEAFSRTLGVILSPDVPNAGERERIEELEQKYRSVDWNRKKCR